MELSIFRPNECDDFLCKCNQLCIPILYFKKMNNKNYLNRAYINVKRDLFSRLCADTLDLKGHTYIHLCIRHLVKRVFQIFDHNFNDKLHCFLYSSFNIY